MRNSSRGFKRALLLVLLVGGMVFSSACAGHVNAASYTATGPAKTAPPASRGTAREKEKGQSETKEIAVNVVVGKKSFAASFYDNETAQSLLAQMPLTVKMRDLNRNEKYYRFDEALPVSKTEKPPSIKAGEIMCWSSDTLVLFYESFSNAYGGYVKLGYAEDPAGLAKALGSGNVEVTFEKGE